MINQPPVDKMIEKTGSRYGLCVVAAKRARQLINKAAADGMTELPNNEKPLNIACNEIMEGILTVSAD